MNEREFSAGIFDGRMAAFGDVEQVEHPRWRVWDSASAEFQCDIAALYGQQYVSALSRPPDSAFLAEGSEVSVYKGVRTGDA